MPNISLGTIYRNLDVLVKLKLIKKLDISGYQSRYDGNIKEHMHIKCIKCGKVQDIKNRQKIDIKDFSRITSFKILNYSLDLNGICPQCLNEDEEFDK